MSKRSPPNDSPNQAEPKTLPVWFALDRLVHDATGKWKAPRQLDAVPVAACSQWLLDSGSLTARLKLLSAGVFSVEVVDELWATLPDREFRSRFGPIAPDHPFWSRRVILSGNGEPWVLAHTLIPRHALGGDLGQLIRLGEKPLGEYLFNQVGLTRSDIEIKRIDDQNWGRRSWFFLESKPILVTEYFLSSLLLKSPPPELSARSR